MKKLIEFGKKAMFYVRVLSGYEERKIQSYRLQLQNRLEQAHEKKASFNRIPEQIILSKVRHMVEEMQALNKKLEETEAAIDEYFKPIEKQAEIIMKMQLDGEERTMKEMVKTMQKEAFLEQSEAQNIADLRSTDMSKHIEDQTSPAASQAEPR